MDLYTLSLLYCTVHSAEELGLKAGMGEELGLEVELAWGQRA